MNPYPNQQQMSVTASPRPGPLGGPPQMSSQGQQQQQAQQPGPPGIGMGRGASSTGLQNSALPLSNNNLNHPGGPASELEDSQFEMLLNSYIYEHLLKSGFYQAARGLFKETPLHLLPREDSSSNQDNDSHLTRRATNLKRSHSGVDNHPNSSPSDKTNGKSPRSGSDSPHNEHNDLPEADVPLKGLGKTGFLRGWWAVFWDIYSARSGVGNPSQFANTFLETQVIALYPSGR
jgi:LisH